MIDTVCRSEHFHVSDEVVGVHVLVAGAAPVVAVRKDLGFHVFVSSEVFVAERDAGHGVVFVHVDVGDVGGRPLAGCVGSDVVQRAGGREIEMVDRIVHVHDSTASMYRAISSMGTTDR